MIQFQSVNAEIPNSSYILEKTPQNTLLVGMRHDVSHIDPVFAWDWQSIQVINQICEGLYEYNLSDPNKVIIPKLATDFGVWNASKLEITIELRQGIKFHDGTDFDANASNIHAYDTAVNLVDDVDGVSGQREQKEKENTVCTNHLGFFGSR